MLPLKKNFQASAAKRQNAISELANRVFYVLPHVLPFSGRGYNITAVIPRLTLISPRVHIYNNSKFLVFKRSPAYFPVLIRFPTFLPCSSKGDPFGAMGGGAETLVGMGVFAKYGTLGVKHLGLLLGDYGLTTNCLSG